MDTTRSIATPEHNKVKTFESLLQTTINQAFTALTLFTRNSGWSEAALLQAIEAPHSAEVNSTNFVLRALELARTMPEERDLVLGEHEEVSVDLPPELQIVIGMPASLRHCFVLRILLGVNADQCAAILGRQVDEVNRSTSDAFLYLAGFQLHGIKANEEITWYRARFVGSSRGRNRDALAFPARITGKTKYCMSYEVRNRVSIRSSPKL